MSVERIREWLKKMNYPGPPPSDDDLQDLCRGAIGPLFQQIMDKVRPREEIDLVRKNITIAQISHQNGELRRPNDALELFERKRSLEKKVAELRITNKEKEHNLASLKTKIHQRGAKIKVLKNEIEKMNVDNVILEKKENDLQRKLDSAQEIKQDSNKVLGSITNRTDNDLNQKLSKVIASIQDHTEKNEYPPPDDSIVSTSVKTQKFYSTVKKFLQSKRNQQATSAKENIFESFNSAITSTVNSKFKKHSPRAILSSAAESTTSTTMAPNSPFFENAELQSHADDLWDSDRGALFEKIKEMKENTKSTLKNLVSEIERYEIESVEQGELLPYHNMIVQNRLLKLKHQREQAGHLRLLKEKTNLPNVIKLEAKEHGIKSAISHLRTKIQQIKLETVDVDLNNVISDIKDKMVEKDDLQIKIDKHACLLYDCNAWIDKSFNRAKDTATYAAFPNVEDFILEEEGFAVITNRFTQLNYHYNNRNYMKGWGEVYSCPELLDIIKYPYLSYDKLLMDIMSQKYFIEVQHHSAPANLGSDHRLLDLKTTEVDDGQVVSKLQENVEGVKKNLIANEKAESIKEFHLSFPYNEMVSTSRLFNGKGLNHFVNDYNEWLKLLGNDKL